MKQVGLLCLGLFIGASVFAQSQDTELISTTGATHQNGGITLDWSIGEIVTTTFASDDVTLTQGYQQGKLHLVSIAKPDELGFAICTYPNPVKEGLIIETNEMGKSYKLFNFNGQVLKVGEINAVKTVVDFSSMTAGTYFLQIEGTKTHKIIKE